MFSPKSREARLVWDVDVEWNGPDMTPERFNYWVDARSGAVIRTVSNICQFDVGGTVNTMASPGALPDHAGNPEQSLPANSIRCSSSSGNVTTRLLVQALVASGVAWGVYQAIRETQRRSELSSCRAWDSQGRPIRVERLL